MLRSTSLTVCLIPVYQQGSLADGTFTSITATFMPFTSIRLSLPRRVMVDMCHVRLSVPLGVVRRTINIAALRVARNEAGITIPWTVLFTKAYGLVAAQTPALRRAYVKLPWPQLSQASRSVASVMIERTWQGEATLFPAKLKFPAERSLIDLAADLQTSLTAPIEQVTHFDVIMRLARWPWPVRRLLWWLAFNVGAWRPGYYGTFGISVIGRSGTMIDVPVSPLSNFISYGPFAPNGYVEVIMAFDHRVMDGGVIVKALIDLEAALNGAIIDELKTVGMRA